MAEIYELGKARVIKQMLAASTSTLEEVEARNRRVVVDIMDGGRVMLQIPARVFTAKDLINIAHDLLELGQYLQGKKS